LAELCETADSTAPASWRAREALRRPAWKPALQGDSQLPGAFWSAAALTIPGRRCACPGLIYRSPVGAHPPLAGPFSAARRNLQLAPYLQSQHSDPESHSSSELQAPGFELSTAGSTSHAPCSMPSSSCCGRCEQRSLAARWTAPPFCRLVAALHRQIGHLARNWRAQR